MINIRRVYRMIVMFSCPLSDVCWFMRRMSWLEKISHYDVIISELARRLLTSPCQICSEWYLYVKARAKPSRRLPLPRLLDYQIVLNKPANCRAVPGFFLPGL